MNDGSADLRLHTLDMLIDPDEATYEMEGPFGEFTGYVSDVPTPHRVIQVAALNHRTDPIFRGTLEGSLPGAAGENSQISSVLRTAIAWKTLADAGVPGVLDVFVHPVTNGTTIVVQIDKQSEGHPKWVASALWSTSAALFRYKNVIVVDGDVDPSDYSAIDWAIAYRARALTDDVVVFPRGFGSPIDPSTLLADRSLPELGTGLWKRVLIDATKTWRYEAREEWGGAKYCRPRTRGSRTCSAQVGQVRVHQSLSCGPGQRCHPKARQVGSDVGVGTRSF